MKRLTLILTGIILLNSCSQEEQIILNSEPQSFEIDLSIDDLNKIEVTDKKINYQNYPAHDYLDAEINYNILKKDINQSSELITLKGYDYRTLVETGVSLYTGSNILLPGIVYIYNRYYYYKRFSAPKGATITWPGPIDWPADKEMGWSPTTFKIGYDLIKETTQSSDIDSYLFVTMVDIITHDVSGAAIGTTVMLPRGNPSEFTYQYKWDLITWGR